MATTYRDGESEDQDIALDAWDEIPAQIQDDLLTWYNIRDEDLTADDYEKLAVFYHEGRFHAYDCGECDERVRIGAPDDWREFQGVCQDEGMGRLCAVCYMTYERLKALAEA